MKVLSAMILLAATVGGCGGSSTCDTPTPCPGNPNGANFSFCNAGGDGCYYGTSDGSAFKCANCGDCTAARGLVASWCQSAPAHGTSTTGGGGGTVGLTCGASASCSTAGRTFQLCSNVDGSHCAYKTSDGTVYDCGACANCQSAATKVSSWCSATTSGGTTGGGTTGGGTTGGGTTGGTTCSASALSACITCCQQQNPTGGQRYTQLISACVCPACPDCSTITLCGGTTSTPTSACATCISTGNGRTTCSNSVSTQCMTEPDCAAYLSCARTCH